MASFARRISQSLSIFVRSKTTPILRVNISAFEKNLRSTTPLAGISGIHTSTPKCDLKEFFDEEKNWGEPKITTGRPWKKDELRLKSNSDLHKLWYVLLKERNMIMTMEAEYEREAELFPNPERLDKLEESMENLMDVVAERDRAYHLLPTGETGEPDKRWRYNALGIGHWYRAKEHYIPPYMHTGFRDIYRLNGRWQLQFKRLLREKRLRAKRNWEFRYGQYIQRLRETFPDADFEEHEKKLEESKSANKT